MDFDSQLKYAGKNYLLTQDRHQFFFYCKPVLFSIYSRIIRVRNMRECPLVAGHGTSSRQIDSVLTHWKLQALGGFRAFLFEFITCCTSLGLERRKTHLNEQYHKSTFQSDCCECKNGDDGRFEASWCTFCSDCSDCSETKKFDLLLRTPMQHLLNQ